MPFKKDDAGHRRWDRSTAGERWGKNANRPDFVELMEKLMKRGAVARVWDSLADADRPSDLSAAEERTIVRRALRRAGELGRPLEPNAVAVLLRWIGGSDRLKTETKVNHAAIRAAIKANPKISLGQISRRFGCSRSTASAIKAAVLSDDS